MSHNQLSHKFNALAKVNLTFEILGKRTDGYHELCSVVTTIPLSDTITVLLTPTERRTGTINIKTNKSELPTDNKNSCFKAVMAFDHTLEEARQEGILARYSVSIHVEKKIPIAGGLGGSSTDAASVIMGINQLLDLKFSNEELVKIANMVGSDLGSFIYGGITLQKGRGDIVAQIDVKPLMLPLLVVFSLEKWETKDAYRMFNISHKVESRNVAQEMLNAIQEKDPEKISALLYNDLELSQNTNKQYIENTKQALMKQGAMGALMSGSGPTVYGIFPDNESLNVAEKHLSDRYNLLAIPGDNN